MAAIQALCDSSIVEWNHASAADLVLALGTPNFAPLLMSHLHDLSGADLCSAFVMNRSGGMKYVLSCGNASVSDETAYDVSNAYARALWRKDVIFQDVLASSSGGAARVLRRMPIGAIANRDYRSFHARNRVAERVSLYRSFPENMLILGIYRCDEKGQFEPAHVDRFSAAGDLLLALLAQHHRLADVHSDRRRHPPVEDLATRFLRMEAGLSRREAEICAMVVAGSTAKDIALTIGVAATTVATYRKRAYRKLHVADRRGLERVYDRCAA